jgi:glycosyltransferase involved in cell wall biosynthesis
MRIAWCTPFAEASRIGEFSAVVVSELRSRPDIEVDIFHPLGADGRTEPDPGHTLEGASVEHLRSYDAIFYNIGDHRGYHGGLLRTLRMVPGIVVLHDVSLNHLIVGEFIHLGHDEVTWEFVRRYGPEGAAVAAEMQADYRHWTWKPENVDRHPLLSFALDGALGVVTHSRQGARQVRSEYAGDVWALPLPALHADDGDGASLHLPDLTGIDEGLDDRPMILQAGVINQTKCIPMVLEAFATADVSERAQLVVCGPAEPQVIRDLRRRVVDLGLAGSAHILGRVSDLVLDALRKTARFATVLRYPIGEAASAALVDSMAYGLATVAVDAGHYAEMPADTLERVEYPPSIQDVADVIRRWVDDPEEAARQGARARQYVRSRHAVGRYADGILVVASEAGGLKRRRELARDLCQMVSRVGFGPDDWLATSTAAVATELFGGQPRVAHEIFGAGP